MAYLDNLPTSFKDYLSLLKPDLKLTMYTKDVPDGHYIMLKFKRQNPKLIDAKPDISKIEPKSKSTSSTIESNSLSKPTLKSIVVVPEPGKTKSSRSQKNPRKRSHSSYQDNSRSKYQCRDRSSSRINHQISRSSLNRETRHPQQTNRKSSQLSTQSHSNLIQLANWTVNTHFTPTGTYHVLTNTVTSHDVVVRTNHYTNQREIYLSHDKSLPQVYQYVMNYTRELNNISAWEKQHLIYDIVREMCSN